MSFLQKQIFLGVSLILIIVGIMAVGGFYYQELNNNKKVIQSSYQLSAEQVARNIAYYIKINDTATSKKILKQSFISQKSQYVKVVDR